MGPGRGRLYVSNDDPPSVLDLLVEERYGPHPLLHEQVKGYLDKVARRWKWQVRARPAHTQSFWVMDWQDQYGLALGITLHRQTITAAVLPGEEGPLLDQRNYQDGGLLLDALAAEGQLILPEADWLAESFTAAERERILASRHGNGWEANSLRYWKPTSRGSALFNGWD